MTVGAQTVTTNAAGGWLLPVTSGVYHIAASGAGFIGASASRVTVGSANIEVDFVSGDSIGFVNFERQQDTTAPAASASVSDISNSGGSAHALTVTYTDNLAIDVSDLDNSDIRVTGPNRYNQPATFVGADISGDGAPRTATYEISAPGGSWGAADNGEYAVYMQPNQVSDTSENHVPAGALISFQVAVPPPEGPSWQNPINRFDVNGDGAVTAHDPLAGINYLKAHADWLLPAPPATPPPFLDVYPEGDPDGLCTPHDPLAVICSPPTE